MKRTQLKRGKALAPIGKTQKKCEICKKRFIKSRPVQPTCQKIECQLEYVKRKQVAARVAPYLPARKPKNTGIVHNKGRATRLCQAAFNALVRFQERDLPCVTCGTRKPVKYDCGHWMTTGAHPELRFRRENASRQCNNYCNVKNGGWPAKHRAAIIERRGQAVVDWLEGPHDMPHWTIDELDMMASAMRAQLRYEKREAGVDTT